MRWTETPDASAAKWRYQDSYFLYSLYGALCSSADAAAAATTTTTTKTVYVADHSVYHVG